MKVALLGPASPRAVDVTLFATLDSGTAARVDGVCPHPYNDDDALDGRAWEALHIACCFERSPSTARRYARPPRAAFSADRMVDEYMRLYDKVL
jgi:hypothetical protein